MSFYPLPTLLDVAKTARLIDHKILKTPVQTSVHLDRVAAENLERAAASSYIKPDIRVFLKCENLQRTGSFKFRGASHFVANLKDNELRHGVVAYSTGEPSFYYVQKLAL